MRPACHGVMVTPSGRLSSDRLRPEGSSVDGICALARDKPHIEATQQGLLNSVADTRARARLLAVQAKESGEWLNALPVLSLGLRLDDEVVRIAAGLRLGVPLCRPHPCSQCGCQVDELGTHGLSCRLSVGRLPRHATINTIVKISNRFVKTY